MPLKKEKASFYNENRDVILYCLALAWFIVVAVRGLNS